MNNKSTHCKVQCVAHAYVIFFGFGCPSQCSSLTWVPSSTLTHTILRDLSPEKHRKNTEITDSDHAKVTLNHRKYRKITYFYLYLIIFFRL